MYFHAGPSDARSVYEHPEIGLLQLIPGRSSPVSHQTPATDPECSCTPCYMFSHLTHFCNPSTGIFENTSACLKSSNWIDRHLPKDTPPLHHTPFEQQIRLNLIHQDTRKTHQVSFLSWHSGSETNVPWLSEQLSHWQSLNDGCICLHSSYKLLFPPDPL